MVWKRPLGEGYSSPAVENGVLYTMYGKPREEVVARGGRRDREDVVGTHDADDVSERRRTPKWATARTPRRSSWATVSSRPASPAGFSAWRRRPASSCGRSSSGTTTTARA